MWRRPPTSQDSVAYRKTHLKGFAQEVCPEVRVAQYWYAIHQDDCRQHFECFLLYIDRWVVKAGAIDTGEIVQAETPFLDALLQEDWSVSKDLIGGASV
jgi:hypothetical protein